MQEEVPCSAWAVAAESLLCCSPEVGLGDGNLDFTAVMVQGCPAMKPCGRGKPGDSAGAEASGPRGG